MKNSAKKIISVALLVAATSSFAGIVTNSNYKIKAIPDQITKLQAEYNKAKIDLNEATPKLAAAKSAYSEIYGTYSREAVKLKAAKEAFNIAYKKAVDAKINPQTDQGVISLYHTMTALDFQVKEIGKQLSAAQSKVRYYE